MRGRPPKPTHLKLIEGNPGKRRINTAEPRSAPLRGPPRHLTPAQRTAWREIVKAAPPHVLQQADRFLIELTARLLVQVRGSPEPMVGSVAQLRQCLGELGLSPSARSRLSVAPPSAVNPFATLG